MKQSGKPAIQTAQNSLQNLYATIEKAKPAFMALGRKYIDPERFVRIVMAAARRPPKKENQKTILDCTPQSVVLACMEAAALGLEPETPQNHCYLIPYGNVCTLQMGYPGLEALALRDKTIKRIETRLRYARDTFKPQYAPKVNLEHLPCLDDDPGDVVGVYAIAHFADGDIDFEYMTAAEVDAIRDRRSKSFDSANSPWKTDEDEMRRKTVLKRACKRWGRSKEIRIAMAVDNDAGEGHVIDPSVSDFMEELSPPRRTVALPPRPVSKPAPEAPPPAQAAPPASDEPQYDPHGDPEPPPYTRDDD